MGVVRAFGPTDVEERETMKAHRSGTTRLNTLLSSGAAPVSDPSSAEATSSGWLQGEPGLPGRVALSWALAGGLTMEGVLVVAALLSGTRAATADPLAATFFFLIGVVGGFVHGALVGAMGRPDGVPLARAVQSVERSAVVVLPVGALAWGAALWISLTSAEAARGRLDLLLAIGLGWLILTGVAFWAVREGRTALRYTRERWPLGWRGGAVLALISALLLITFVWWRPEIWFTDVRTTALGAGILALGVTVWFALPLVVLGIHLLHRQGPASGSPPRTP
jgi:hypothetical protein